MGTHLSGSSFVLWFDANMHSLEIFSLVGTIICLMLYHEAVIFVEWKQNLFKVDLVFQQ